MYLRVEKPVCISGTCLPRKVQLLKCGFKTPPIQTLSQITDLSCSQSGELPGLPVVVLSVTGSGGTSFY